MCSLSALLSRRSIPRAFHMSDKSKRVIFFLSAFAFVAAPSILMFLLGKAGYRLNALWLLIAAGYYATGWFFFQRVGQTIRRPPLHTLPEGERRRYRRKLFWIWVSIIGVGFACAGALGYLRSGIRGMLLHFLLSSVIICYFWLRYRNTRYWPWRKHAD